MSISSIHSGGPAILVPETDRVKPGRRPAREALGEALGSGNLEAAQAAFKQLSEAGADDRVRRPDGPFARLQAALDSGDLQAAGAAYQQLIDKRRDTDGEGTRSRPLAQEGTLGRHIDISA